MSKTKIFRTIYNNEDSLAKEIQDFLNNNGISREKIIDARFTGENGYLYYLLIWEE